MPIKIINGELRAYIRLNQQWRHVYLISSYDQETLLGDRVRMINFKLRKGGAEILSAEKSKFHQKKPRTYGRKNGIEA